MLDPIIKTIEVPCSQERAFKVFLNEMDSWWPLGKFTVSAMGGAPAKAIRELAERPPAIHFVQKYLERPFLAAGNFDGLNDRIQHYVLLLGVMRRTISAP